MFGKILTRLLGETPPATAELSPEVAFAALCIVLAKADGDYADAEAQKIKLILCRRFSLTKEQASAALDQGQNAEQSAADTVRFTRVMKDAVAREDRFDLMVDLWSVVLADDHRDHEEDGQMRLITNLLGLPDRDSAHARQEAARKARANGA